MRPGMRKLWIALILLILPVYFSGCIVCTSFWCDQRPPHRAVVHAYVYDYYTGAPIPWAVVDLYEEDWWSWDHVGTWPVNAGGYAQLYGGYLYRDGRGGSQEEDYRVEAYASGYYWEFGEFELDYYHPTESIYFYLVPYPQARERGSDDSESDGRIALPEGDGPADRVRVGEPRDVAPAP